MAIEIAAASAGAIVSSFVKPWAEQAFSLAHKERAKFFGVEEDLEKLSDNLVFLDRVLDDAEQKQRTDEAVKRWFEKFRGAAYDAEDILDHISTEESLRWRTDEEGAASRRRQVISGCLLPPRFNCSPSTVFRGYMVARRVRNINKKLENLKEEMKELGLQHVLSRGHNGPAPAEQYDLVARETTSSLEKDVCGRIEEKEGIIKQLLSSDEEPGTSSNRREGGEKVSLIPIVGMGGVGKILKLSYQHLPAQLRRCFAYCCLFPKDWKFDKWTLIRQWMAQGYLNGSEGNRRMEDVGNLYFNDLLQRSFLQNVNGAYVMHDLMHDLAESVSMGECLRFGETESAVVSENVRHVSFHSLRLVKKTDIPKLQKLRSCLISVYWSKPDPELLTHMLCQMKFVRVLAIDIHFDWGYNLQDGFRGLRHLRYLHLGGRQMRLPDSICGLYNLQTLSLDGDHIYIFPKAMNKLVNLRHLIASPYSDIAGIGRLTSLQELTCNVKGQKIGELHNINQLRGKLSIRCLEEVGSKEDAMEADLKAKVHLDDLSLSWTTSREPVEPSTDSGRGLDDEVIDALVPPPNLTKLMVVGNQSTRPPRWMQGLTNLTDLRLEDCHEWEQLPPVEHMPRLRHLVVSGMPRVKRVEWKVGIMGADLFPVLETLELSGMTELEECVVSPPAEDGICGGDHHAFPSLRWLSVSDCPKLRMLPCFVSLRMSRLKVTPRDICGYMTEYGEAPFSFVSCPMLVSNIPLLPKHVKEAVRSLDISEWETGQRIQRVLQRFSSVEELMLHECPGIQVLPDNGLPPLLRKLNIFSCTDLQSLPAGMHLLSSLQELRIAYCPQIQALPDNGLPPSLCWLEVDGCEGLQSLPASMHLLSSLQELRISYCPKIQALPDNGLPPSLRKLWIINCYSLQSLPASPPKLEVLVIRGCPQIRGMPKNSPSLRRLWIGKCQGLQSLPFDIHLLSSLQELAVCDCPQIQALPENGLPPSLTMLSIWHCPQLEERCREKTGLDWPKIAHLPKDSVVIGAEPDMRALLRRFVRTDV